MEDKQSRLFLAVLLSLGAWMAVNYYFFPTPPPKKQEVKKEAIAPEKKESPEKKNAVGDIPAKPFIVPAVNASEIKKNYIATSSFLIQFSSLGGRIEKFYIRNYKDLTGAEVKILKTADAEIEFNGQKYKAIEISRSRGFNFNPSFKKEEIPNSVFDSVNFKSFLDEKNLTMIFEGNSPDKKFAIRKEYRFFPDENYFKFKISFQNNSREKLDLSSGTEGLLFRSFGSLGPVKPGAEISENDQRHHYRYFYDTEFHDTIDGGSFVSFWTNASGFFSGGNANKDKNFEIFKNPGSIEFAGSGSRYFIAVIDPLGHKPAGIVSDIRKGNESGIVLIYDNVILNPSQSIQFDFASYVGLRESDGTAFRDKALDPNQTPGSTFTGLSDKLNKSFNQGLTTPFRNGILWVLKSLYQYTIPNYGWCIIIFAILFKLVFYPLNQKQADSMKKMQELSPQIKEINERYAKDPTVKQQKIMELYKKNGTNPMAGCLPMVIQIPIFIALYTAFSDTIELWRSPFLWVGDLSEPDTVWSSPVIMGTVLSLNILPIIMVGTQVGQTFMTSVSTDPNQKTMMYLMPVIMLYFFWSMPAGVTLYWTMQNVLSIIQQVITNKFGSASKKKT
ncbi:MAG: membrane protein insertase YidC [Leptospira sp.]|nr:membrane protein insertase YidC [Leptospira sp.]